MSFADELLRLQRVRSAYIRLAQELNPTGPWTGDTDRRFGRMDDSTMEIPIKGTVESFGVFQSHIANHEFTIEIPSTTTEVLDPENEWKALADRPSHLLLHRKLGYYVRQAEDDGDRLDQLIALGQIGQPSFPDGRVQLSITVPGGDFLGEDLPRRLVTERDWPRSLPDVRGEAVPFVYGSLRNTPPPTPHPTVVTGDPEAPPTVPVNGVLTGSAGFWIRHGPSGQQNLFQAVKVEQAFQIVRLHCTLVSVTWTTIGGISTLTAVDWRLQLTYLDNLSPVTLNISNPYPHPGIGQQVVPADNPRENWDAHVYAIRWQTSSNIGGVWQTDGEIVVQLDGATVFNVTGVRLRPGAMPLTSDQRIFFGVPNISDVTNIWQDTENAFPTIGANGVLTNPAEVTLYEDFSDGVYDTWSAAGWTPYFHANAGPGGVGYVVSSQLDSITEPSEGSAHSNIEIYQPAPVVEPPEEEVPTPPEGTLTCDQTDGASDLGAAGRGGWLRALLVDTGGGTEGLSDYPAPSVTAVLQAQPHAAPTLSATVVNGGTSVPGNYSYVVASVHADGLSELSNIETVGVGANQRVELTWSGVAAGATAVRLWRAGDPSFLQFDVYRVGGTIYYPDDPTGGGATDLYPGYDTRGDPPTPDGQDPHWDLVYRQTKYYTASALYSNGVESACGAFVEVPFYPRQAPLSVEVTWGAVTPPTGVTVTGYRIRRANQSYHFGIGFDRQWDFDNATFSFIDPNTDTSATSECATEPTTDRRPTYLLAGHTLFAVREVFVLRPDPESDTNEFVQVLMTEGVDYEQAVVEINGNRYHVLYFNEPQRSETCQYYEVTANVDGVESNADGTGYLLTNADEIFEHIMLNIVFNTYHSSVGPYAPSGGRYYTDVPYSPGLFNRASVLTAMAAAAERTGTGYVGAGALTKVINARQLIHDLLVSYDLELYQYNGAWYVSRFNPSSVNVATLPALDPDEGIFKASFEPTIDQEKQVNLIPFFAGPLGGTGDDEGYMVSGEQRDDESIDLYRRVIISDPVYLLWTQDSITAYNVVAHYLQRLRFPPIGAICNAPIRWYQLPVGTAVSVTHPNGLGPAGWNGRVCRIFGIDLDLDQLSCRLTLRDVDADVP